MSEVSWKLRKTLADIWIQLYAQRGEMPYCRGCPMQLVCAMKYVGRYTQQFWCTTCAGLVYKEERLIIRCRAFAPRELVQHAVVHKEYCPNCWMVDPAFKAYRIIQNNFHKLDHTVG